MQTFRIAPARLVVEAFLRKLPAGAVTVRYPEGKEVTYGEGEPYFTVIIRKERAFGRLLKNPGLTFGECYVDGDLEIEGSIEDVVRLAFEVRKKWRFGSAPRYLRSPWANTKRKQPKQIQFHYDVGNEFFRLWLDESMTYSCAYYLNEDDSLEAAQRQKREHVLRKAMLEPGQRVLEIGSGWGTLLVEAAKEYGVSGMGVTLSKEQLRHANELAKREGVDDKVHFELRNYQDVTAARDGQFDRVYSVAFLEAVGRNNMDQYFDRIDDLLVDGGVSFLHTVTKQGDEGGQAWIDRYVFPGHYVPPPTELLDHLAKRDFRLIHMENLRYHYAKTLAEWHSRFEANRSTITQMYDERFYRIWKFYLQGCAGSFRNGAQELMQMVFTKGINNEMRLTNGFMYPSPRVLRAG